MINSVSDQFEVFRAEDNFQYNESLLTIAIPTYKRPELLRESILSAVNQLTSHSYSIIIVDNDSNTIVDHINDLLSNFKHSDITYYRNNKNIGLYPNWNRCIDLTTTTYLTILGDDDLLPPDFVEATLNVLINDLSIGSVFVSTKLIDKDSHELRTNNFRYLLQEIRLSVLRRLKIKNIRFSPYSLFFRYPLSGVLGLVFKKSLVEPPYQFNTRYYPISDYCFFLSLVCRSTCLYIVDTVVSYRVACNILGNLDHLYQNLSADRKIRLLISKTISAPRILCNRYIYLKYKTSCFAYKRMWNQSILKSNSYNLLNRLYTYLQLVIVQTAIKILSSLRITASRLSLQELSTYLTNGTFEI